jgi:hypothetical protein
VARQRIGIIDLAFLAGSGLDYYTGFWQFGERTVHLDGCVEVDAAYYSAPPGWIGRRVQV